MMSFLLSNPTLIIAAAAALVLAVWLLIAALCAEQPFKGTLEWIALCEKPRFCLPWSKPLFGGSDAIAAAGAAVFHGGVFFLFMQAYALQNGSAVPWGSLLFPLITAFFGGGLCYLLGKASSQSTTAALLGSLLLAFDLLHSPAPAAAVLLLLTALYLFFRRDGGKGGYGFAAICGGALCLCVIWEPNSILLCVPLFITLLLDGILRMVKGQGDFWQLLVALLLNAICFYLCMVGAVFIMYLSHGAAVSLRTLSDVFAGVLRCVTPFTKLALPSTDALMYLIAQNPSVLCVLVTLVFSVCTLAKRRDAAALYLLIWGLGLSLYALASASPIHCVTAALCLSYLTGRLFTRNRPGSAAVAAAAMGAVSLALTVIICY